MTKRSDHSSQFERLGSIFAQSNHLSIHALELQRVYRAANQKPRLDAKILFDWVDNHMVIADLVASISPRRYVAWNLQLLLEELGTVEFRIPPQSTRCEHTNWWIGFTVTFVSMCLRHDWVPDAMHEWHPPLIHRDQYLINELVPILRREPREYRLGTALEHGPVDFSGPQGSTDI